MATYDTGWYDRYPGSSSATRAVCQYSYSSTTTTVSVSAYTETWWRYWNSWTDWDDSFGQVAIDYPIDIGKISATIQVRPNDSNSSGANGGNTSTVTYSFERGVTAYDVYPRCRCYNQGMPSDTGWHTAATINVPALPTPAVPTDCAHVRNSDVQNTVTWTRQATTSNPYRYILVERRVNAGSWAQIAQVDGSLSSYTDATCAPNASYQYRVRSEFHGMYSGYSAATTLSYNTPAAPGKPSTSRQADNSVLISFTNTGQTQTLTRLQRSVNASTWADVKTVTGTNVTSTSDTPGAGTFYYRVRNERSALVSAWSSSSDAVAMLMPPLAPTLLGPSNNSFVLVSEKPTLTWRHNPQDGSSQTAAEVQYATIGSWLSVPINGSTASHVLDAEFPVNVTVYWQMRTKGADVSYGQWSASNYYRVVKAPSISITSPGTILTNLPLMVTWSYSDPSGTQASADVSVKRDGSVMYTKQIGGNTTSLVIPAVELFLDNNSEYALEITVISSSGASAHTSLVFQTSYIEPGIPDGIVSVNEEYALVSLTVYAKDEPSTPLTAGLDIYRMNEDGTSVTLAKGVASATKVEDTYPPLDQALTYIFVAHSEAGAVSRLEQTVAIPSRGHAFINIGDDYRRLVRIALDMAYDEAFEHSKEVFVTANDPLPHVVYSAAKTHAGSVSGKMLRDKDVYTLATQGIEIADIDELMEWNRRAILRLPYKEAMAINTVVRKSIAVYQGSADVTVNWEQVRPDGLMIAT